MSRHRSRPATPQPVGSRRWRSALVVRGVQAHPQRIAADRPGLSPPIAKSRGRRRSKVRAMAGSIAHKKRLCHAVVDRSKRSVLVPVEGRKIDAVLRCLNRTFSFPGNTVGSASSTMAFLASLVATRDVFSPLLDKGPPNTSKRACRGIYGAFLIVGVWMIKIDVRRLLR